MNSAGTTLRSPALVLAPMRWEARALRRGAGGRVTVLRTGVGPAHSARAAGRLAGLPIVVAGVGGALAPYLATGDVVVATELRCADGPPVALPEADRLGGALRSAGLTVHIGGVFSARRLVSGARRAPLAAAGALLVDTESYWLAAGTAPVAVVRVVADTAADALLRPAMVPRLRAALRRLSTVSTVLAEHVESHSERQVR